MPSIAQASATPVAYGNFSVSFLAAGGDTAQISLRLNPNTNDTQRIALQTALGNLSNAAVYAYQSSEGLQVAKNKVTPLDESYSSASEKLVLQFQDDNLELISMAVPAPDESYFGTDGATVDITNVTVAGAITTIEEYLNENGEDPAGTFAFVRGYRTSRSRSTRPPRTVVKSAEPTPGQTPPAEPGT